MFLGKMEQGEFVKIMKRLADDTGSEPFVLRIMTVQLPLL